MASFKIGDRVILPAIPEEGIKEERGELLSLDLRSGTSIVRVDRPIEPGDDCLREQETSMLRPEVTDQQIEEKLFKFLTGNPKRSRRSRTSRKENQND